MKNITIVYLLLFALPLLCLAEFPWVLESDPSKILRIAIVGSGIGGASSAFLLKKNLGPYYPNLEIVIYEQNNYIGGRVKAVSFKGKTVEMGASAFSAEDKYIQELAAMVGLPVRSSMESRDTAKKDTGLGIYDGIHPPYVVHDLKSKLSSALPNLEKFKLKLDSNYNMRDSANSTFQTIEDFLQYGLMDEYTVQSSRDFAKNNYMEDPATLFYWGALTRAFYNQGLEVNAFAGLDALLRWGNGLTIPGGLSRLIEALIAQSGARVRLDSAVTSIANTPRGIEVYSTKNDNQEKGLYDYVIIASSLEEANIEFRHMNDPLSENPARHYSTWRSTLVSAQGLNPSYFKMGVVPDNILASSNAPVPFSYIRLEGYTHHDQEKIYRVVSNKDITNVVEDLFLEPSAMCSYYWGYSSPSLQPLQEHQPTFLSNNVLYLNNLESIVPNLESSVIGAKNAVRLMQKELLGTTQPPSWWGAKWLKFPLNLLPAIALIGLMNSYLWKQQRKPVKEHEFIVREVPITATIVRDVDIGDVNAQPLIIERPMSK